MEARAEALLPTYLQGPAGSMFVVVADALQLAASGELPDDELEAAPQTLAVEEDEELGHHPGEGWGGGWRTGIVSSPGPTSPSPISFTWKIRAEGAAALAAVPPWSNWRTQETRVSSRPLLGHVLSFCSSSKQSNRAGLYLLRWSLQV